MQDFLELIDGLDQTKKTSAKVQLLVQFFEKAAFTDRLWTIALFLGKKPKKIASSVQLRLWASELAQLPEWLFEECYHSVGDLAETIAHLLPDPQNWITKSLTQWLEDIHALKLAEEIQRKSFVILAWNGLDTAGRFAFNKLITGGFRIGVSKNLVIRALAEFEHLEIAEVALRLTGNWQAWSTSYEELITKPQTSDQNKPFPFCLAHPLDIDPNDLGPAQHWQAEYKWDGIRAQLVHRQNEIQIWSRGEELLTEQFPEFQQLLGVLPNSCVLDGEILAFNEGILPFGSLQQRISRKNISKKLLQTCPVVFRAYDLLEIQNINCLNRPLFERQQELQDLLNKTASALLQLSEVLPFKNWSDLEAMRFEARQYMAEGLMIKKRDSVYAFGRKKGLWWKWKLQPLHIDAVLIYAMKGHGKRADLYTDYTFAVWHNEQLTPFAKAYSGLNLEEIKAVDRFVKQNTLDRFGPVRSVKAELVFEIAFEGIQKSSRHKSGIAVRFPRISRWRTDKKPEDAGTLNELHRLLEVYGNPTQENA